MGYSNADTVFTMSDDPVSRVSIFAEVCSKMRPDAWQSITSLEKFYIPSFGLNDEILVEQPEELSQYFGGGLGLRIWQYPNQFAGYLAFIAGFGKKISSYMEIGSRFGGTCLVQVEMLRSVSKSFCCCVALDIIDEPPLISEYRVGFFNRLEYWQVNTQENSFDTRIENRFFDLVFIDGDHSYDAVKSDSLKTINRSNIQVFHDITNDAVPGVRKFWNEFKKTYGDSHEFHEFTDQYDSVAGSFLGIGVAVRKNWISKKTLGRMNYMFRKSKNS
jgi:hypothetical protein